MNINRDLRCSINEAFGLEVGPSGRGESQSGRDFEIVEDDSGMEGSAGRKLTSEELKMEDMIPNLSVFGTRVAPERPGETEDA